MEHLYPEEGHREWLKKESIGTNYINFLDGDRGVTMLPEAA